MENTHTLNCSFLKKLHDGTLVLTRKKMITSPFFQTVTRIITRILSLLSLSPSLSEISFLEIRRKFDEGEERSYEETWEEFCSCYNFVTLLEPRISKLKEIVIWIIPGWEILEIHRFLFLFLYYIYYILYSDFRKKIILWNLVRFPPLKKLSL